MSPNGEAAPRNLDKRVRTCSVFLNKTASIAFLELQGANGRKFHLSENAM